MKRVSIQDLKAQLSGLIAEAEGGQTVVITRHAQPVAQLGPALPPHVHRGSRVASGPVRPAIAGGTKGRYLIVLLEDRGGE